MIQVSPNDFYDYPCAAKKFNLSLIPFCSLRTFLIRQNHYKKSFSGAAIVVDVGKGMPELTNQNNVKVMSLTEIFPDITFIKNGKKNVSEEMKRGIYCMFPYIPQIDNITVLLF